MQRFVKSWLMAGCWGLCGAVAAADIEVESVVVNLVADVEVPAKEAGALVEIPAAEGHRVEAGAVLARIDDRDAALEVTRAEIALEHARQQAANDVKLRLARQSLKLAELELKRAEDANRELEKVVSATQIEKLRIEVEKSQLEVELALKDLAAAERAVAAAKNELLIAQRAVERRTVVAPMGGTVVDVRRRPGEWLEPGQTVVRLVRDDRLRAEGFVLVDTLTTEVIHQPAELIVALPGEKSATFRGTVTFVSPEVNPINRQVRVWAEFDNADGRLRSGIPAKLILKPATSATP
ncbi:MAG TPA: HlyD family efflux transporter periplasmic adaptor subunit [Pirellulaceae bacterium]|nr:HlyD family efflux transporter periplasmic adaptor subunit [Pirellulaceae bacterium]